MEVLAVVLTWGLAAVLFLILLVLCLPLRLELMLRKQADWQYSVRLRPFGRIGPSISLSGKKTGAEPKAGDTQQDRKRRRRGGPFGAQRMLRAVVRLLMDILYRIRIGQLTLDARFGLGDPAATGQTYGALMPVVYAAAAFPGVRMNLVPVFDIAELTGAARLNVSLIPVTLIGPALRFGWQAFRAAG
ncbi:MAG: DUF2953 domain-containing protein [Rhodobacteraceae bacterium]|nr:DUF2953 domain-containing protein [Paracoccaceae bacterium]